MDEISEILNSLSPNWAMILSNGDVIKSTLEEKNLGKMIKILKVMKTNMDVSKGIIIGDLFIYRITSDVFVFVSGKISKTIAKTTLDLISAEFKKKKTLSKEYFKAKKTDIDLIMFSMALDEGPEPVFWITESFDEQHLLRVSIKSLMLFSVESGRDIKDMISFQPYLDLNALGIIFLFQIKSKNARGGAYDCTITVLIDYNSRALFHEHYSVIEKLLKQAGEGLKKEYNSQKNYARVFTKLKYNLNKVSIETVENDDIKFDMLSQIKKLADL